MNARTLEIVSEKVHQNWMDMKLAAGVTSRKLDTTGEELMVPFSQLSERARELDRGAVMAVFSALSELPEETRKNVAREVLHLPL